MFWKIIFCRICSRGRTYTPSSSDIDTLLSKIQKILDQLKAKSIGLDRVIYWEGEIKNLKATAAGKPGPQLPMKDGKVDASEWQKKSDTEKREPWELLCKAFKELCCLNQGALCVGRAYFWMFLLFLVALFSLYHSLHRNLFGQLGQPRITSKQVREVWAQARTVELKLADIKAKKESKETDPEKKKKIEGGIDTLHKETSSALEELKQNLDKLTEETGKADSKQGKGIIQQSLQLPFETAKLLGTVSAEAQQDDPAVNKTYEEFLKHLTADLESFNTAYFWTISPWRWFELAWWAEFGCLVGLLFYIAGLLSQEKIGVRELFS